MIDLLGFYGFTYINQREKCKKYRRYERGQYELATFFYLTLTNVFQVIPGNVNDEQAKCLIASLLPDSTTFTGIDITDQAAGNDDAAISQTHAYALVSPALC